MYTVLSLLAILVSIILIIVVLLQSSKGGGLAGITGGSGNFSQAFGSRRTADFLSKFTWWLGGIILVLAISINMFFLPGKSASEPGESIIQSSKQVPSVPSTPTLPEQTKPADNKTDNQQK
ncbi:MAG: preprotein translocase subunit SecG [Bacteroidetes bacterium]|nr:preprotein translocase subunit SecG [Bacteroidota bacterium]